MYPDPNRQSYPSYSYPSYSPFPVAWVFVGGLIVMVLTVAVLMIFVVYGPRQIAKDLGLRLVEQYGIDDRTGPPYRDNASSTDVLTDPSLAPQSEPKDLSSLERISFPADVVGIRLQRTVSGNEIKRFALTMQQGQQFLVETDQPHAAVRLSTSKGVPLDRFQRRLQVWLPVDDTYIVGVHSTHNRDLTVTITFTAY